MRNILITGANRGIGLELSRRFAGQEETTVFAACRNPREAAELKSLTGDYGTSINILELDVADPTSITACISVIEEQTDSLWALVNNAGIFGGSVNAPTAATYEFGRLEMEPMLDIFRTNTVAPILVAQAAIGLLEKDAAPRIINVSSDAGSISLRKRKGNYTYPASKAALNMMTKTLAEDTRGKGVVVVSVHPGFLRTDMGGPNATLSVDDTIPQLATLIENLTMEQTGAFLNWDGAQIPW